MKKFLNFLRSMRFGIILLLLIAACSVAGSVIPQGREFSVYAEAYPRLHGVIFLLGLDDVFSGWFFVLLMAMLALNLTLCSLIRIRSVVRAGRTLLPTMAYRGNDASLSAAGLAALEQHLKSIRCRRHETGGVRVYTKNLAGRYGSFVTHLSILLVLVFGAAGLYLPEVTDQSCLPGESITMPDGTEIAVRSFYIENESGQLDFTSDITVTLPEGQSKDGSIRVNYPLSLGPYKIYQQTFATAGSIRVTNPANGGTDYFTMTETSFLSLDGVNGLWYLALYPDHYRDTAGHIVPTGSSYGRYTNPVYHVQLSENGEANQELLLPGDMVSAGGLDFTMGAPIEYPGLRIKYTPPVVNTLLFLSFALMIVGLYMTFFMQPVLVKVDSEGYVVGGPKREETQIELQDILSEYEEDAI